MVEIRRINVAGATAIYEIQCPYCGTKLIAGSREYARDKYVRHPQEKHGYE